MIVMVCIVNSENLVKIIQKVLNELIFQHYVKLSNKPTLKFHFAMVSPSCFHGQDCQNIIFGIQTCLEIK